MGRVTFPRMAARLAAIATALLSTAAVLITVPAPSATAATCPDVDVVFGRGTGEPDGIGRVGQALAAAPRAARPARAAPPPPWRGGGVGGGRAPAPPAGGGGGARPLAHALQSQ